MAAFSGGEAVESTALLARGGVCRGREGLGQLERGRVRVPERAERAAYHGAGRAGAAVPAGEKEAFGREAPDRARELSGHAVEARREGRAAPRNGAEQLALALGHFGKRIEAGRGAGGFAADAAPDRVKAREGVFT